MAQLSFHASLNVTGDEKLRALSPPLAQAPPASSSGQPGTGSSAGVATEGRYGTTAGSPSCARTTVLPPRKTTVAATGNPTRRNRDVLLRVGAQRLTTIP